jgi:hypothetical protein
MTEPLILEKVTMIYVAEEDRVKMQAEFKNGQKGNFWLTQRLCLSLVPVIIDHLDNTLGQQVSSFKQGAGSRVQKDSVQSFYQDSAMAKRGKIAPVVTAKKPDIDMLVVTMDIDRKKQGVVLKFPIPEIGQAVLPMKHDHARQWLSILCELFAKASWPMHIWPVWITESIKQGKQAELGAIH